MTVEWLEAAIADLAGLHAYIAIDNPAAAGRMVQRILTSTEALAAMPSRGRPGRVPETRELVISPYVIAYHVGEHVQVLRVLHGARRWPDQF
jgi:toxin ParE1/3/4